MSRNVGLAVLAVLAVLLWAALLVRQPTPPETTSVAGDETSPTATATTPAGSESSSPSRSADPTRPAESRPTEPRPTTPVGRSMRRLVQDDTRPWRLLVLGDGTGDDEIEWVRVLADRVADETGRPVYLRTWSVPTGGYGEPVEAAAGEGAPVEVFNASAENQGPSYSLENLAAMAPPEPADLVVVSHGHNIADPATAAPELDALTDAVRRRWPRAGLAVTLQNPRLDGNAGRQAEVTAAIREQYENRDRVVLVRVLRAFGRAGDLDALVVDSVVPNARGSRLWADTAWEALSSAS